MYASRLEPVGRRSGNRRPFAQKGVMDQVGCRRAERGMYAGLLGLVNRARKIAVIATTAGILSGIGCGGSSSSTTTSGTIGITVNPASATIPINTSVQFSATVSNADDTSVTWQVNETTGGSA